LGEEGGRGVKGEENRTIKLKFHYTRSGVPSALETKWGQENRPNLKTRLTGRDIGKKADKGRKGEGGERGYL